MPLIDSDNWKAAFISLKQLHFHPANPRFPELPQGASEREIIHELCVRGQVDVLARIIAEKGYFRNDRLIVFKEGNRNVVYEGNRRLCALKVLANPDLSPPALHRKFRRLAEMAKIPKKIAVDIVPTKFDAEVVMYSKHAGDIFMVKWEPIQQATFIAARLDQGDSVDALCHSHGLKREQVIEARSAVDLFRIARLADLSPEARTLVDDPGKFPYSVVYERLVRPKKSRQALGLEITENGLVVLSSEERFLPLLGRILEDAAKGEIDTRTLNDEGSQLSYVQKLGFTPGGGRFTAEEAEQRRRSTTQRPSPTAPRPAPGKPTQRSIRSSACLLPSDLVLQYHNEKLVRLLHEGKRIRIDDYPHACACLLRTLLECALKVRLKAQRLFGQVPVSNPTYGPSLADMINFVNQNSGLLRLERDTVTALRALVSRKWTESKSQLDRIVHSPDVVTHAEEVVSIRQRALPLLREILRPPS